MICMQDAVDATVRPRRRMYRIWTLCLCVVAAFASTNGAAQTEAWKPERAAEFIVSSSAGSNNDQTARMLQSVWQASSGISTIVVNKPGAGGGIAINYINQRKGDASYLLFVPPTFFSSAVMGEIQFDRAALTPIATLFDEYVFVTVRADSPIKSGRDFIEQLKAAPDSHSVAIATAIGNDIYLGISLPMSAAGVNVAKMLFVPFKGSGESITALLGGHVDVAATTFGTILPYVKSGQLRVLGVSAPQRLSGALSDVPTWREQGADAVFSSWRGVAAPAGITPAQRRYWESAVESAISTPAWKEYLSNSYRVSHYRDGAETRRFWDEQYVLIEKELGALGLSKATPPQGIKK